MALVNALGNIALDASVQQVKTSVDAIVTTLDNGVSVSGSTIALDSATLLALETINANTGGLTDAQLRASAVPVSGTFWQATQPVSASSLPLPTGAATETTLDAIDTKLAGTLTITGALTDAQLRATPLTVLIDSVSNNLVSDTVIGTDVALTTHSIITGQTTAGGGAYVNVKVNPSGALAVAVGESALPTGAATEATLNAINGYFKEEDSAHVSGDKGVPALAIRSSIDAVTTDADGDYTLLKVDEEGRLKVSSKPASYPDITGDITAVQATIGTPVAGGTVTGDVSRASNVMAFCMGTFSAVNCTFEGSLEATGDTNWFAIQAVRSNANTIETTTGNLSAQPAYAWEMSVNALKRVRVRCTARTSGTQSWRFVQGTYATEPIPAAQVSGTQPVSGTVSATNTPVTPTTTFTNSAATTNGTVIKASAGTLWNITATNINAAVRYLKLYNSTTVTVGTTTPVLTIAIPAGGSVNYTGGSNGLRFATGICLGITTGAADNDTGAVAANEIKVATSYT